MVQQHIQNHSNPYRYFAMIPHIADDDLTLYEYRLYGHYVRVCGQGGGQCSESEKTTYKHCNMSQNSFRKARQGLIDKGFIDMIQSPQPNAKGNKGQPATIIILDRWDDNHDRFRKNNESNGNPYESNHDPSTHLNESNRDPYESNGNPYESNRDPSTRLNESNRDPKNNLKTVKNSIEKESASNDAQSATQMQNPEPSQPTQPQSVKEPGDTEIKPESGILTDHPSPPETISPPSPQDEDDVEKQRSKDISAIIKIHLDTGVIDSKPGQSYKNKTKRGQAEAILDAGITVEQVRAYVDYLKQDEFWQEKSISLGYIVNNIKAWVNSTEAEPENPAHKLWEPDDFEPFYWVDDPEKRAAMLQNAQNVQQGLADLMSMDMGV